MKKILLLILLFQCIFNLYSDGIEDELDLFFGGQQYTVLNEPLKLMDRSLVLAVHYIDQDKGIFDNAIAYEKENSKITIELHVKNGVIENRMHQVLSDVSNSEGFFGFSLKYSYPKNPGFDDGLLFIGYFDYGNSVADPAINIVWKENESIFRKYVLDFDNL